MKSLLALLFFCFLRKKLNARFVCVSNSWPPTAQNADKPKTTPSQTKTRSRPNYMDCFFCDRVKDILKRRHERGARQQQCRQQHRQQHKQQPLRPNGYGEGGLESGWGGVTTNTELSFLNLILNGIFLLLKWVVLRVVLQMSLFFIIFLQRLLMGQMMGKTNKKKSQLSVFSPLLQSWKICYAVELFELKRCKLSFILFLKLNSKHCLLLVARGTLAFLWVVLLKDNRRRSRNLCERNSVSAHWSSTKL